MTGAMENPQEQAAPLLPPPPPQPSYGIPSSYQDPYNQPPTYILLPSYPLRRRRRRRHPCLFCNSLLSSSSLFTLAFSLILLFCAIFFLYPSDPDLKVVRLHLNHIHISPILTSLAPAVDVSLGLKIRIRNKDFFSLDYQSIVVSIGYRGRRLGFVTSDGGHVRARGVSYVDAELRLDGIRIIDDVFYLIEDFARGSIPFDTVTEVEGQLRLFFLDVPVQGRISCVVNVNPENQTVARQDCYSE